LLDNSKQPCVYILASKRNGTLYVGVTSNLIRRVWQHKTNLILGFTSDNAVHTLVWYEQHQTMASAIERGNRVGVNDIAPAGTVHGMALTEYRPA